MQRLVYSSLPQPACCQPLSCESHGLFQPYLQADGERLAVRVARLEHAPRARLVLRRLALHAALDVWGTQGQVGQGRKRRLALCSQSALQVQLAVLRPWPRAVWKKSGRQGAGMPHSLCGHPEHPLLLPHASNSITICFTVCYTVPVTAPLPTFAAQ